MNNFFCEENSYPKHPSNDYQIYYDGKEESTEQIPTIETIVIASSFTDEDRFKKRIYVSMKECERNEESKYSDDEKVQLCEFVLFRFDYQSLKWIETNLNLNGFIAQRLNRYQYLYLEENNKIMFLGLNLNPLEFNNEYRKLNYNTVDLLGAYCAQIEICADSTFEYVPSFQVAKSRFSSVKIESTVFIIGGNDDLKTCYQSNDFYFIEIIIII